MYFNNNNILITPSSVFWLNYYLVRSWALLLSSNQVVRVYMTNNKKDIQSHPFLCHEPKQPKPPREEELKALETAFVC